MEYDELYHENPKQKKKDIIRQKEIQKLYSDFKFKRIKESKLKTIMPQINIWGFFYSNF